MVLKQSVVILRLIFVSVFLYSGILKLNDLQLFANSLNSYNILPAGLVSFFAIYIPVFEIILALSFLWPGCTGAVAVLTAAMLVLFQVALASLLIRGIEVDCGCFGRFATSPKAALLRNFVILLLLAILLYLNCCSVKLQNRKGD